MLDAELEAARADPRRQFGRYVLLSELGRGGMGIVYRAWDEAVGRLVALKVLAGDGPDEEAARRFAREGEAMAALAHPGIVAVHDAGVHAGRRFIAMSLLEGGSLKGRLRDPGRPALDLAWRVALLRDVARAVHAAHERGIVHRDLKPENVLLDRDGRPFVSDFGLARFVDAKSRLTATGTTLGTPAYMPPEQVEGAGVDARSDVYALGATLFFALTGRPPFEGATPLNVITAVLRHDAAPPSRLAPDVPPALDAIVARCLAKEPAARFATAEALAQALDAFLASEVDDGRVVVWPKVAVAVTTTLVIAVLAARATLTRGPSPVEAAVVASTAPPPSSSTDTAQPEQALAAPTARGHVQDLEAVWERRVSGTRAWVVAISPDGAHLAAGSDDGSLAVWSLSDHEEPRLAWAKVAREDDEAEGEEAVAPQVKHLAFSRDGRTIFSAGHATDLIAWNAATGTELARNADPQLDIVWDLELRASGSILVLAGPLRSAMLGPLLLAELESVGSPVGGHPVPDFPSSLDLLDGEGELLVTAPGPRATRLMTQDAPGPIWRRTARPSDPDDHLMDGIFVRSGLAVAGVRKRRAVFVWNTQTGARRVVESDVGRGAQAQGTDVRCLAGTGDALLSGGNDGVIAGWRVEGEDVAYDRAWPAHAKGVACLAVSPDGRRLASAGDDGFVRLWRLVR